MNKIIFLKFLCAVLIFAGTACKGKQASPEVVSDTNEKAMNNEKISTENDKKTILCFGNSLTAGYGLDEQYAWPSLLQQRLIEKELEYNVINAGLSGETAAGGLNRIDWVLNQPMDIFILELGANDMLRGFEISNTIQNLSAILDRVRTTYPQAKILIAGMLSPPNMGPEYERAFNQMYPDLARKVNGRLIPFFLKDVAGIEELNLPDGKHPNKEGQKIVLENVWNALESML